MGKCYYVYNTERFISSVDVYNFMAYTEIKKKNGRKYFYRAKSIREKNRVGKKRIYLGIDLKKEDLQKKEKEADKELFLLPTLLLNEEAGKLEEIRKRYL